MTNPWYSGNPAVNEAIDAALLASKSGDVVNADTTSTLTLPTGLAGELLFCNSASAQTLSVPQDSDAAYNVGAHVTVIQIGAGLVTVAAGTGAAIHKIGLTLKLGQYARVTLTKIAANSWAVNGDLAAS